MEATTLSPTVTNVTSEDLREYMKNHKESDYVLIDVRQSEEYLEGHIPGARLMPLNELESYADELKQLSNRDLIFYCRGGARSARASAWATQVLRLPSIRNLLGGFSGWQGPALTDFPRLSSFELNGSTEALLRHALELEKGTHRLYEMLLVEYPSGVLGETISALVGAELAHGQAVHKMLAGLIGASAGDFETAFANLPGNIIENGVPFDVVLSRARELGPAGSVALLELALEIELGAYDLYKNLAGSVQSELAQKALTDLAQQEKGHADLVLKAIGKMFTNDRAKVS